MSSRRTSGATLVKANEESSKGITALSLGEMTKPIKEMTQEELIWAIEGYAQSARRSFDKGEDPWQTLSRIRSMIDCYQEAEGASSSSTTTGASASL